jgi:hypothetical protein
MDRTQERDNFIRNNCGYNPDGKSLQVKTIQIESRAEWLKLKLPPSMKPAYIRDSLKDLDTKAGSVRCEVWGDECKVCHAPYDTDVADACETISNGKLLVSLLRFKDHYAPGIYNIIYIIHTSPHNESIDGHLHDCGPHQSNEPQLCVIQELFDESPRAIMEEWTETSILHLFAENDGVGYLIERYLTDPLPEHPRHNPRF